MFWRGDGANTRACLIVGKGLYMKKTNLAKAGVSRRTFLAGSLASAAAAAMAGCSKGGSDAPAPAGGNAGTDEEGFIVRATKTDGKSADNDFVIAIEGQMTVLHPMNWSNGNDGNVVNAMYDPLIRLDEHLEIAPCLAKSWEVSDDALTYTFHLRDDIVFADKTPLDAQLVVDNYHYTTDKAHELRRRRLFVVTNKDGSETWRVESVTAPDNLTVVFKLAQPWSPFMRRMAQFEIISRAGISDPSLDFNKASYGSGPYVLKEWVASDHTTIVPNENYWGDRPKVDSVTFREVPEAGSRIAMLQTGEADFVYPTPSDQIETLRGAGDINMKAQKSTIMRYVTLNNNVKGLNEEKVRQAINLAVDKDAFVGLMYAGYGEVAKSCIPDSIGGFKKQEPYKVDLKRAKELMAEAGYADGFTVTLWCDNSTQETKGATFIMQQLEQIGIKVDVQPMESATVAQKCALPEAEAEVQMWYVNWSQSDADGYMRSLLSSGYLPPVGYNTAFWKNDEFDTYLNEGNASATEADQNEYYGRAQDLAWKACPWIFLASDNLLFSYKAYASGVVMTPDSTIDVSKAELAR